MPKLAALFLLTLNVTLVSQFSVARIMGGGSDGGGCGVRSSSGWVLKDYVRARTDLSQLSLRAGVGLPVGPVARMIGYEILDGSSGTVDFVQQPAAQAALARINEWKKDSPEVANLIDATIRNMHWALMQQNYQPVAFGCRDPGDQPIVVYFSSDLLAAISAPLWNVLPFASQEGAVIKEALRFLQNQNNQELFGGEGLSDRSELFLSQLVSRIITGRPRLAGQQLTQMIHRFGGTLIVSDWPKLTAELHHVCASTEPGVRRFLATHQTFFPGQEERARTALRQLSVCANYQLKISPSLDAHVRFRDEALALLQPAIDIGITEFVLQVKAAGHSAAPRSFDVAAMEVGKDAQEFALKLAGIYDLEMNQSPELAMALQGLQSAAADLNHCAQTRHGEFCDSQGIAAYRDIAADVAAGKSTRSLNRNILATRALFAKFGETYFAK